MADYNEDGILDSVDALHFDDNGNGGSGFREWTEYEHPELGTVEIGGFHPKFFSQNGPPHLLEEWASKQALFNLQLALHLPQVEIDDVSIVEDAEAEDVPDGAVDYRVAVRWTNTGQLPTALRQAQLVKIVREDSVRLELPGDLTKGDEPAVEIVVPELRDKTIQAGWTQPEEAKEAWFRVRVWPQRVSVVAADSEDLEEVVRGTVHLLSTRGGHRKAEFEIGG